MPRREDERHQNIKSSGLRWCVVCHSWFPVEAWEVHGHNPCCNYMKAGEKIAEIIKLEGFWVGGETSTQ